METSELIISSAEVIIEEGPPKNVTEGLQNVVEVLKNGDEASLKKDKCVCALEPLADNNGLNSYVRTQLLDILALIEQL